MCLIIAHMGLPEAFLDHLFLSINLALEIIVSLLGLGEWFSVYLACCDYCVLCLFECCAYEMYHPFVFTVCTVILH